VVTKLTSKASGSTVCVAVHTVSRDSHGVEDEKVDRDGRHR
jgi:hypothetical protein